MSNALAIDFDKPDFVNEKGVKWYKLDMGDPKYGTAFRTLLPDGGGDFVIIENGEVNYHTKNLEQLAYEFTAREVLRRQDGE